MRSPLLVFLVEESEIIRYNGYHQIKNAHTNFQITEVNDDDTIKALYENSALTFFMEPNSLFLDFLYNWFNYEGVIKENNIKLYVYNGKKLKNVYKYSRVNDSLPLMSIFLKDLNINVITVTLSIIIILLLELDG